MLGEKNQFNSDFLPLKQSAFHTLMHNSLSKSKFFGVFFFFFQLMGGRTSVKIYFLWVVSRTPWLNLFRSRLLSWHRHSAEISKYPCIAFGNGCKEERYYNMLLQGTLFFLYLLQ